MPPEIVTLPLRAMMQVSAGQPIHVIVEVALDRGAPDPYADLGARCAQVAAQLRDAGGTIADPQDPAIAPYVFALLTASQVETVAASAAPIARLALNEWFSKDAPRGAPSEFNRRDLIREVIAEPLATRVRTTPGALQDVIIDLDVTRTSKASRAVAEQLLGRVQARDPAACAWRSDADATHPYIFASMTGYAILALIDLDRTPAPPERAIYRVWEDATVRACINRSIATVKADAAQIAFSATGKGIVWGVLDSGIDATHPHFAHYKNLDLSQRAPLAHRDLRAGAKDDTQALVDVNGHGTHVAGIIFGAMSRAWEQQPVAVVTARNEAGIEEKQAQDLDAIAGMAPQCTLLSLRVLDDDASGRVSTIIDGIDQVQRWNDFGRRIVVHGLNLSLGYPFEAEWFACGQSPLCIEIDRLVSSGVVVVVAAGNSGYGYLSTEYTGAVSQGIGMSINDPGNAELAITVGATHRTEPHRYGVSYFSSKGPTGDGRSKPDVLAPGERIISCASAQSRVDQTLAPAGGAPPLALAAGAYTYKEDSGTSMAAPHVSGIIAAFLSIRQEYIGRPGEVKAIFTGTATDLRRDRNFQGAGLVDLMRAIQSV
ncbi:S8 family peptidase [Vulcanimicrobium alpinum]|nr:S8 family peptidase [Vulcanimicrobium alpinum]